MNRRNFILGLSLLPFIKNLFSQCSTTSDKKLSEQTTKSISSNEQCKCDPKNGICVPSVYYDHIEHEYGVTDVHEMMGAYKKTFVAYVNKNKKLRNT